MVKFKEGDRVLVLPDASESHVFRPYADSVGQIGTVNDHTDVTGCGVRFANEAIEYIGYEFLEATEATEATELLKRAAAYIDGFGEDDESVALLRDIRAYLEQQEG